MSATAPNSAPASDTPVRGARLALILLLLINVFNYIDRQVLAAVEPDIREDFFKVETYAFASTVGLLGSPEGAGPILAAVNLMPDRPANVPHAMFLMGLLSSAFLVTYMLTAPLFGWLANRMSRWVLVGIGVALWSLASGASGLAPTYLALLITRCFVGIGEAVYGPVAPTMIADLYPVKVRGQKLAWFYAAIPVGGALGYGFAAEVMRVTHDWRWPFYLVVPPGLVLAVWCFLMRDPPRGQADAGAETRRETTLRDYVILLKTPSYVLNTLGMTAMTFAMGGLAFWVPGYLRYRHVGPLFGVDPVTAFGAITAASGLAATLLGGIAGDRLKARFPGSYFLVSGAAMVVAAPLLVLMTWTPFPLAWVWLTLFVFFLFFNTGPTNTILANVTHPLLRAPGFALNILVIHLLGDVVSPPLMGAIADRTNLDVAFGLVSMTVLLGGILWLWGTIYLERDTALAPKRLAEQAA
jgi:MFS family permease